MDSEMPRSALGDVAEIVMGQSPPGDTYNDEGVGVPLINGPAQFGDRAPVATKWTTAPTKLSQVGDVVFCVRGSTTGRMVRADGEYCLGRGVASIRGATQRDSDYIYYALHGGLVHLLQQATGSTFPNLSSRSLSRFELPWPEGPIRHAIAEVLGALDERIEHLRTQEALYDAMMRSAYQQLQVEVTARVNLGEVVEINPSTPLRRGVEAPYFDMGSLPERGFLPGPATVRPYGSGTRFIAGDILLARITPCLENGKTGIVPPIDGEVAWGSTEFIVMRASRQVRGLVYGLSRNPDFRDYAVQHMSGSSGRQRVKADDIARYRVPDLTSPAAARLGGMAAGCIEAGMALRAQIETVASLRDALLSPLLSGEVRIEDPARILEAVA